MSVIHITGEALFKKISDELATYHQTLKKCIGFASDGAASMEGVDNSVQTRIKIESPKCVQLKCICHSLALCMQHAFSKLTPSIGFILTEVPLWFANSNLRREEYKDLLT